VADEAAYTTLARACAAAGLEAARISLHHLSAPPAPAPPAILIYDLHAPGTAKPRDIVRAWRSRHPNCPVLLYHAQTPDHAALLADLASPGTVAWPREPASEAHLRALTSALRHAVAQRPRLLIQALLLALRPDTSPRIRAFLAALSDRLDSGAAGAPQIATLAAQAGCTPWQLRRECRRGRLPAPERLVEWLTLIYVLGLASMEQLSVAAASRRAGLGTKYLQRARQRLLPHAVAARGGSASDALAQAVQHFARSLGAPGHTQSQLITDLLSA
jgi:GNAT superfamily N-acetyltransferase